MVANNRRPQPGGVDPLAVVGLAVALTVLLGLVILNVAIRLGHALTGTSTDVARNPFRVPFDLASGETTWPGAAGYAVVVALVVILFVLAALIGWSIGSRGRRTSRVDNSAAYLGRGRDIESMSRKSAATTAQRLGAGDAVGVPIGVTVGGRVPLFGSWEDMHVDVWGPRTGKTTSRAIPAILDAPGPVLVTSNKRDVVDATRDVRTSAGDVWVFDPQQICNEPASWWWDPLSYVVDEVRAAKLAEHFATGSRAADARTDAFFDPAGEDLLAGLLLAAAVEGRPITDVYRWTTRPMDEAPVDILRSHGYPLMADQVAGVVSAPEKQRGGIYGTAMQMASCLKNSRIAAWVTPAGGRRDADRRPRFDPDTFVRAGGTVYSLSKEGKGTAGPLVTALTVAIVEAAEELAARSAGGRLATPMLGVLDEAANVCRWRELPNLYSHYGSRGIVLMTILQSWSQGTEVWGEAGMRKLWSAANVKVYGGGVSEAAFLEDLSRIVGDYDRATSSVSSGRGGRSVSHQLSRERILDVADLAAMPKGRALVLASGSRPTLITTQPWMTGPHAARVRASIVAHDPQGHQTLAESDRSVDDMGRGLDDGPR